MNTLAIDIGGTKFSLAAFEREKLILHQTRSTDREQGPAWMVDQIEHIYRHWRDTQGWTAERCGIGFGGPVDFPSQTVTLSTHVFGWAQYPLISRVRETVQTPVVMDNDANVGALGEYFHGAGKSNDPVVYVTLSTGIGGGIIIGGRVYRGADSFAGEIGHLNIDPSGPECLCGSNGCFERLCCGLWLERDYGRSAKELLQSDEFMKRYVVLLARGLKAAIMLLNPARIVVGGGISLAGERLFGPLREELGRQITAWSRARRDVVAAELGNKSVLYGALALAKEQL
ncbi:MAG: ROK family protein [Acidobacteriaceae bacterium]|nr:ROK family protein [Acidobacteriaceae bacterium]